MPQTSNLEILSKKCPVVGGCGSKPGEPCFNAFARTHTADWCMARVVA